MVKDIIKYNEKEYQISTALIENVSVFETMVFPIENGIVSGNEVYCFRTTRAWESWCKHADICYRPEEYVSNEVVEQYLACKHCNEWCCTLCQYNKLKFRGLLKYEF